MNKIYLRPNRLWRYINNVHITKSRIKNLSKFKSNPVNFKIALFNPTSHGVFYLKSLINYLSNSLSHEAWASIKSTTKRNLLGNPITVKYNGEEICLDYIQAALELEFLRKHLPFTEIRSVLEIGAGYGRTSHMIISNCAVEKYYIVDLYNCLQLSQAYLEKVLNNDQFSKFHFVSIDNIDSISGFKFNLCINIDSFAEMDIRTVRYYLEYIDKHCDYLYSKNPVCNNFVKTSNKERPGKKSFFDKIYHSVVNRFFTGNLVLPEVIDIFDADKVKMRAQKYVDAYRPGTNWKCIADSRAMPWSHYWQAIYTNLK